MDAIKRPENLHKVYHAHIYFDESSKEVAKKLCDLIDKEFQLKVGRFHEKLVGPHPCWSCQVLFSCKDFDEFIPWLDEHRQNLSVLVHALTGDNYLDHTNFAYWLGDAQKLDLSLFEANL